MKTKRIELKIETEKQYNKRMKNYMHQLDRGVRKRLANESLSVESISGLKKILTPKRIELLASIREHNPESVYKLAKLVNRKQENVQADVVFLSNLGLIHVEKSKTGRKQSKPKVDYDIIDFRVPLAAGVCLK